VKEIQSTWLQDVDPSKYHAFFSHSSSGWSNDDHSLAWLKEVFHSQTKENARREYRLLLLDGHGSQLTMDFITFCDENKIILAVFPPQATHKLQPLGVVLYGLYSRAYNGKLTMYLHNSQGLLALKKGDFFLLFWDAWTLSFTTENIILSFKHTGINPIDPEVVLKQLQNSTPQENRSPQEEEIGAGSL
jgi:hypothetical protein